MKNPDLARGLRSFATLRSAQDDKSGMHPVFITSLEPSALPRTPSIQDLPNVKALAGTTNRYRIRIGDYRVGVELNGDRLEVMRVLHRREFYRYFP